MEDRYQEYREAFQCGGWELDSDTDDPGEVVGYYNAPNVPQDKFTVVVFPDGPQDPRGEFVIHDLLLGDTARVASLPIPQEAVALLRGE